MRADQTVGGPEWCTVYKRKAAEARRPPKGIILPLNRWPSVKAVDERIPGKRRAWSVQVLFADSVLVNGRAGKDNQRLLCRFIHYGGVYDMGYGI